MNRRSFSSNLLLMCWIPLVTLAAAVGFQVLRISGKKTEYYALGRVIVGNQVSPRAKDTVDPRGPVSAAADTIYGTQIEILESGALRVRALERVRALHPELKEIDVEVRVAQTKGSAILNIAAVGDDPKYTRIYLDALLDEYIAFRKEMIDKSIGKQTGRVIDEVLVREKVLKEKRVALDQFERANDSALLSAEHDRRVNEVSKLRGELEELKRSGPDESKMKALMDHLEQAEKARADLWEKASRQLELRRDLEESQKAYEEWKRTLEHLDKSSPTEGGMVAIMERPKAAVAKDPDVARSLLIWGAMGLSVGVVLMLIAAAAKTGLGGNGSDAQPPPLS